MQVQVLAGVLCSAVGFVLYLNTLSCGFCYDDKTAVLENKDLLPETPWSNLLWDDFWGSPLQSNTSHKSYRPLCVASFRLNYMLHGLDPMGYHLINVILHAIVCYLYVQLCGLIFKTVWPALIAGLLFAVHPIHTEAVAGVVGRADLMCAIFYLLSLLIYYQYFITTYHQSGGGKCVTTEGCGIRDGCGIHNRRIFHHHAGEGCVCWCHVTRLVLVLVCVICATLSKEHGITALGVCLSQDILTFYQTDFGARIIRRTNLKLLLARASVLTGAAALLLVARVLLMKSAPTFSEQDNEALSLLTPYRQLHWLYLIAVNVRLLMLPTPLLHDYRMNAIPLVHSIWDTRHLLTISVLAILVFLCYFAMSSHSTSNSDNQPLYNRQPLYNGQPLSHHTVLQQQTSTRTVLLAGLLLLIIPFLPASNLFFTVGFVVAERMLYLPSMGACLLVGYGTYRLATSRYKPTSFLFLFLLTSSAKTVTRNLAWQSRMTLYASVMHHYPHNGHALANIAREFRNVGDYKRAELTYRHSIRVAPDVIVSYINLATMLQAQGRLNHTEQVLHQAIPMLLRDKSAAYQLAPVYTSLCNIIATNNSRLEEAMEFCQQAVEFAQDQSTAHNSLGVVLLKKGEREGAIQSFKRAAALNRTSTTADFNLALVYLSLGDHHLAQQTLERIIATQGDHKLARQQLELLTSSRNRRGSQDHATMTTDTTGFTGHS